VAARLLLSLALGSLALARPVDDEGRSRPGRILMLEPGTEIGLLQTLMQLSEIGAPGLLHLGIPGIGRIGPAGVSIGAHLCLNLAVSPCRKLDIIIRLIRAARADAVSGVPRALLDAHLIAKLFKALKEGAPGLFAILALSLLFSMFFCCAGEFDLLAGGQFGRFC